MKPLRNHSHDNTVPLPAAFLGAAGAIPFVGLVLAPLWNFEPFGRPPLLVLALYASIILSFMGAVHWGLAMAEYGGRRETMWSYLVSVMPALLGWFSLAFLPQVVAFRVIAAAFVLLLAYDIRAVRLGRSPPWYTKLRWPLTLIVVPSLLFGSLSV
jgi:hypothetical protein